MGWSQKPEPGGVRHVGWAGPDEGSGAFALVMATGCLHLSKLTSLYAQRGYPSMEGELKANKACCGEANKVANGNLI